LIRKKMTHKGKNYSVKMQKYYFCNGTSQIFCNGTLLCGLIFEQVSISIKVNVGTGTLRAVLMFVRKKQIRQETEQHGASENS